MGGHRIYAKRFFKSFLLKECQEQRKELISEFLKDIEWMRQVYECDWTWSNMSSMQWIRWLKKWEAKLK